MANFRYQAVDKTGKLVEETISAASEAEVATILKQKELMVVAIKPEETKGFLLQKWQGVSLKDKMILTRHLATMIRSGLPLTLSVEVVSQDASPKLKRILEKVHYDLESGRPLSTGLAAYPEIFDKTFVALIRSGETSGNLVEVLTSVSQKLERDLDIGSRVKGALLYPAVILSALILIGGVMVVAVVPKVASVFEKLDIKEPIPTKILFFVSKILNYNLWLSIGIFLLFLVGGILLWRSPFGKRARAWIMARLPLLKGLSQSVDWARLTSSLSLLLKSGVPVAEALLLSSSVIAEEKLAGVFKEAKKKIEQGVNLSDHLKGFPKLVPVMVVQMVAVGERTGKLDQVLADLNHFYEVEVEVHLKAFASLIEPILMLVVGVLIGVFVISLLAPIYQIVGQVQQ